MGVGDVSKMTLKEAVELLLSLLEEFQFATPADKGRAIAAVLTPP